MAAGENFVKANGFLRVLILVIGATNLGLVIASFGGTSAEVYQLVVVSVFLATTAISLIAALPGGAASGMCKIADYTVHAYGCWLLINSAMAKCLVIYNGRMMDSPGEIAIRVISAVFGFVNAGLYSWLAHMTAADKAGLPCLRRTSSSVSDTEAGIVESSKVAQAKQDPRKTTDSKRMAVEKRPLGEPVFTSSPKSPQAQNLNWSWKRHCSWDSMKERLMWTTIFDGALMQMRVFTLVLGLANIIFISNSYLKNVVYDEYFLGVVCFNFGITVVLHCLYLLGVSGCVSKSGKIFDYSFHCSQGVCLLTGATLALAVTIKWATLGSLSSSRPPGTLQTENALTAHLNVNSRTIASIMGICNGILYVWIGLKQRDVSAEQKAVAGTLKTKSNVKDTSKEYDRRNEDELDNELAASVSALNSRNSQVTKEYKDKNVTGHRQGGRTTNIFDPNKF